MPRLARLPSLRETAWHGTGTRSMVAATTTGGTLMRNVLQWSVIAAAAFGLGCSSVKVGARAPLAAHTGELGHVNTAGFALGDLVVLNPQTREVYRATSGTVRPADLQFGVPFDRKAELAGNG